MFIVFLGLFTVFVRICDDVEEAKLWNKDGSEVTVLFLFA